MIRAGGYRLMFVPEEEGESICWAKCGKNIDWEFDYDEPITGCFNVNCPLALTEIQRIAAIQEQEALEIAAIRKQEAKFAGAFFASTS
jgi:hypothetical protein